MSFSLSRAKDTPKYKYIKVKIENSFMLWIKYKVDGGKTASGGGRGLNGVKNCFLRLHTFNNTDIGYF